ncbi:hypothetical protein [Butyrivibrio proteoclasticus]|uniref:hypothetical protein n=1 Tax=Butyrivibrio proteoclasticus TaxID=43305 RepID=UPI000479198E|nr:hypothetical protein [Butyrivibrio proteoclasticus]
MKKKVVAMLILAMLVTGCGANGKISDESATEQTSVVQEKAGQEVSSEEASDEASADSDNDASDETSSEDSNAAADASSVYASSESSADNGNDSTEASNLLDGTYNTELRTSPVEGLPYYVKSIEVTGDTIILNAAIYQFDADWNLIDIGMGTYTLKINENTRFLSGGGEDDPTEMSRDEFAIYVVKCADSGLGLSFKIVNGYLSEIGIWS